MTGEPVKHLEHQSRESTSSWQLKLLITIISIGVLSLILKTIGVF